MTTQSMEIYPLLLVFIAATLFWPVVPEVAASALQDNMYDNYGIDLNGFLDLRAGARFRNDLYEKDASLAEMRLQLDVSKNLDWGSLKLKTDLSGDDVSDEVRMELREANILFSPQDYMDIKLGRQILTWGTGDLLFINDFFPKDWVSFFIGRDNEYLKGPSDAIKVSLFSDYMNADLIYVPVFNGSTYIDGSRISYWNSFLGRVAGRDFIFTDHERNSFPEDGEFAVRVHRTIGGIEAALYVYNGFWKTPEGMDQVAVKLVYPRLNVYGASARWPILGGIGNIEAGYYNSSEDRDGTDPFLRNSEWRILLGLERELGPDFTSGVQYYLEWMQDYDAYKSTAGQYAKDEYRHVFTLRLTRLFLSQNLRLTFFTYYSPSDDDGYLRPNIHYKLSDQWAMEAGGNIFWGATDHTFFSQFRKNSNIYTGIRRTF